MNAQELTKVVNKIENQIIDIEKTVKYLNSMIDKHFFQICDLQSDMKQVQQDLQKPGPVYLDKEVKK